MKRFTILLFIAIFSASIWSAAVCAGVSAADGLLCAEKAKDAEDGKKKKKEGASEGEDCE